MSLPCRSACARPRYELGLCLMEAQLRGMAETARCRVGDRTVRLHPSSQMTAPGDGRDSKMRGWWQDSKAASELPERHRTVLNDGRVVFIRVQLFIHPISSSFTQLIEQNPSNTTSRRQLVDGKSKLCSISVRTRQQCVSQCAEVSPHAQSVLSWQRLSWKILNSLSARYALPNREK